MAAVKRSGIRGQGSGVRDQGSGLAALKRLFSEPPGPKSTPAKRAHKQVAPAIAAKGDDPGRPALTGTPLACVICGGGRGTLVKTIGKPLKPRGGLELLGRAASEARKAEREAPLAHRECIGRRKGVGVFR